jgi:acyltransferase
MSSNRIKWIDTCKGIGIILVIIGHTPIDPIARSIIYAFHMPLFFFISGYFFSADKHKNVKNYTISKFKTLLIPYISFSIIAFLFLRFLFDQPIAKRVFLEEMIISKRNNISFDDPIWFLTSLFTIEIIYYLLAKYIKNSKALLLIIILIAFMSTVVFKVFSGGNILPWSLDQSLYYLIYFGFGHFIKKINFFEKNSKNTFIVSINSLLFITLVFSQRLYYEIWSFFRLPASLFSFIDAIMWAILGISLVVFLAKFLSSIHVLNFLGRNSLILMSLHIPLGFNFYHSLVRGRLNIEIINLNLFGIAVTLFTILILIPICLLITKYFPFILGRNLNHLLILNLKKKEL